MSSSSDQKKSFISSGLRMVLLLSVLSLELTILSGRFLGGADAVMTDLFMRWRMTLSSNASRGKTDNIILMAIDPKTQQALGRYGAGMWLSRKPFVDNMDLIQNYYSPSVMAYDIILIDPLEDNSNSEESLRVSEYPVKLKAIARDLASVKVADTLPPNTLENMNRLVVEQGNKTYVSKLAEIQEGELFGCLLAMNLRGGSVEQSGIVLEGWSDADVFGDDENGDEDMGLTIPYLKDMSIPEGSVHFPDGRRSVDLDPSPNGGLPTVEFLDYVYLAAINGPRESDGVVRRMPMVLPVEYHNSKTGETREFFIPSFSLSAALLHMGFEFPLEKKDIEVYWGEAVVLNSEKYGQIRIPIDKQGRLYLNYDNAFNDFAAISFSELAPSKTDDRYNEKVARTGRWKKNIDGKIAMVGITVTGHDVGATPLYSNIPLVFVQMTAVNNILTRSFIAPLRQRGRVVLLFVMFILVTLICHYEKSFKLGPALFLFGIAYFLSAYISVHSGWTILPLVQPLLYVALCAFSILSYRFFTEERAKRKIRGMFSTMVSDKVLMYLEENPESFSLQGRNIETTVFFSDVARFTTISESLPPEKLTNLLNSYLTPVTDCIMEYGGYVDKYVGDGIMAVWGAPNPDPEHALRACLSALEQQEIIANMNDELKREYGANIHVRMGLNSGIVTAGNMGSEKKFQYTVMGDVVNLASRLEPVNKDFQTSIIIGDATAQAVKGQVVTRILEKIVVKGKQEIVPIYELVGKKDAVDASTLEIIALYDKALGRFHARDWKASLETIEKILNIRDDGASLYLKKRVKECIEKPPEDSWQGEYVRQGKG